MSRPTPIAVGRLVPVLLAIGLAASVAPARDSGPEEPRPPDLLELVLLPVPAPAGLLTYEAIVKPALDAEVELELVTPADRSFDAAGRRTRYRLRPGEDVRRIRVHAAPGEPVRVRLSVLDENGKPWLVVEREQSVAAPPATPGRERVPVVRALPDGKKIVEYMDRQEARRRGLVLENGAAAGSEAGVPPEADAGGDVAPERVPE